MHTEEVTTRDQELLTGSTSEIALALERREVSFPMLMKLLYLRAQGEDQQKRWSALYHRALTLFMEIYGGISESFYANEFVAGALLTRKDELFFNIWWDQFKFDTIPARSLEADINDLENDLDLVAWGYGVAVENADDRVKALARFVCPSAGDEGVAQVIEALLDSAA